jgi:hypothetical protein
VSAVDSGAGTGLQEAEDISQRAQVDNIRDSEVVVDLPQAGVVQSVVTAPAPDTAVVPSSNPSSLPVSQEEVNPVGVKPDENKPDEQEVLDSSVSAKPEDKPWEFQVCRDVDQFGKPLRGLQENDIQFDYRTSLWQRDAAPHPRQDDWDASNQRPKPSTSGWGKPARVATHGWAPSTLGTRMRHGRTWCSETGQLRGCGPRPSRLPRPARTNCCSAMVPPLCHHCSHFWSPQSAKAPPDRVRGAAHNPDIRDRGGGADDPRPLPRRYLPQSRFATGALDDHISS